MFPALAEAGCHGCFAGHHATLSVTLPGISLAHLRDPTHALIAVAGRNAAAMANDSKHDRPLRLAAASAVTTTVHHCGPPSIRSSSSLSPTPLSPSVPTEHDLLSCRPVRARALALSPSRSGKLLTTRPQDATTYLQHQSPARKLWTV